MLWAIHERPTARGEQTMTEALRDLWPYLAGALTLVLAIVTSGHAILYKRDSRAAVAWVGLVWLAPVVGAALYALFGINRIHRRAAAIRGGEQPPPPEQAAVQPIELPPRSAHLHGLVALVQRVARKPALAGNRITPLENGDAAYPAMLEAIEGAQRSVALSTYIFDNDRAGRLFVEALGRAVARGVETRVLIDDVGARYSLPSVIPRLRRAGVSVARFLPTLLPWRMPYVNLRTHRKILVVDGRIGFTGGLNVRDGHWLALEPRSPVRDLHFRVDGPVVGQLHQVFAEDWNFCTGETPALEDPREIPAAGTVVARGLPDGPDADFEKLRWTIHGAVECAQRSVRIVTPYFLPDQAMIVALSVAALTGIEVDIVLPEKGNLALVQWASRAILWQVLEHGCRVWLTPPPFDHTKLLVVDGVWSLVGSSNWDPRSLRLNFEFNLECHDEALAAALDRMIDARVASGRRITLEDVDSRSIPVRLRDGVARLFSPYL
jgi:cardiolipin synthase